MTKYRLKDRVLQKKLDDLTDGEFSTQLSKWKDSQRPIPCKLYIFESELEKIQEYTPKDWNNYPDVTPPEGVLMRVETEGGRKFCGYYHSFAEGGCWCYEDGTICPEAISKSVKRYRTWE